MAKSQPGIIPGMDASLSPEEILTRLLTGDTTGSFARIITGDEVANHPGRKILVPEGMSFGKAKMILERVEADLETETSWDHNFLYRPDDGANAANVVIKDMFGIMLGHAGWMPAESRTIAVGVGRKITVPWGELEIPSLPGLKLMLCDRHAHRDYGQIFEIHAVGPKKYKEDVEALFEAVEAYLKDNSIYRGKAIYGANNPEFFDTSRFDPAKIIYSDEVVRQLESTLHGPIKYTDTMRKEGVDLKRAIVLSGPFGTGKTSEGEHLAQLAEANGWTWISARPGVDNVEDVLRTAKLYQPAVVFIEDIDGETSSAEQLDVSKTLDAFDGITAKGGELMIVLTTNHIERIHKGMLRPGRIDGVVEIAELDRNGTERLIKVLVDGDKLAGDIDYDKVFTAMENFLPAYIKESVQRAKLYAINRLEGKADYVLATDDLVDAALGLRPQLDLQDAAGYGEPRPTLDVAMEDRIIQGVKQVMITDGASLRLGIEDAPKK